MRDLNIWKIVNLSFAEILNRSCDLGKVKVNESRNLPYRGFGFAFDHHVSKVIVPVTQIAFAKLLCNQFVMFLEQPRQ